MHQTKSSLPDRHTTKYFVTNIMALLDRWEEGRDKVKHPKAGKREGGGNIVNINQYMYLTSSQWKAYYSKNLYSPVTIGEKSRSFSEKDFSLQSLA